MACDLMSVFGNIWCVDGVKIIWSQSAGIYAWCDAHNLFISIERAADVFVVVAVVAFWLVLTFRETKYFI